MLWQGMYSLILNSVVNVVYMWRV